VDASTLALQAVGGFTVGALIGYAARKVTKWLLVAAGLALLPIFALWQAGVLSVDWGAVNELVGRLVQWLGLNLSSMTSAVLSAGAFGVSGAVGFVFGISGGLRGTAFPEPPARRRFVKRRAYTARTPSEPRDEE